ncbi:MAG: nuclear transport factor 2 family protein [Bacteroidia bacterium]|nr:nuclear transport factor 2 family protein [Bacteroidia bacterium]
MHFQPILSHIFCCFISALIMAACNSSTESASDTRTEDLSEKNIALVQKFIDAQMAGDGETMKKLVNDDFLARNPAGDTLTIEEYATVWTTLSKTRANQDAGVFATNTQNVSTGALAGEWVMFWGTYTAEDLKSQEVIEVLWHADFMIKDAKISRSVTYFDIVDNNDSDS